MEFSAFENSISSPALKDIALHWDVVRDGRAMPSWEDIRPRAIAKHLPIVWSYKYDAENDEFVGRLAGEHINRFFSRGIRGVPLASVHSKENFPWIFGLFKKVVTTPALYRSAGCIFKHIDRVGFGERIMLPLASNGWKAGGVFGATEYKTASGPLAQTDATLTKEKWF